MKTIDYLDVSVQCPNHEGNFDCTPFCNVCEGNQELDMDYLLERASTVAWDGCHKIYLNMDIEQTGKMVGYGYSNMVGGTTESKQDAVFRWYEDSCSLRFLDAVFTQPDGGDQFVVVVSQFEGEDDE